MEKVQPTDKTILLLRQLKDIQSQAERIIRGEKTSYAMEGFARYSAELKEYARNHLPEPLMPLLEQVPDVNYARTEVKLWQYFILPALFFVLWIDYAAKNRTMDEIARAREKYAYLEMMLKARANS